jgi:biotin carboxyl carrier protein
MEAMKMEHQIKALSDIVIEKVLVSPQKFVEAGQPLFKLKQN